jgi:hypothetical protein
MGVLDFIAGEFAKVQQARFYEETLVVGTGILALFLSLVVMLGVTYSLRLFFKKHEFVTKTHKVLIYILTMSGVIALLLAGILGIFLPIIPGIPLLMAAFLLMRRYHKIPVVERFIRTVKRKARRLQQKVNKSAFRSSKRG